MGDNVKRLSGDALGDHWARLDAFLQTDPRDVGCDASREMLDVYAEMHSAGDHPAERFPGLHAHFSACGPCAQDLAGLLAALTGRASAQPGQPTRERPRRAGASDAPRGGRLHERSGESETTIRPP